MATEKLIFFNLKMEILIYFNDKIFCPHTVVNFWNLFTMGSLIPTRKAVCVPSLGFFLYFSSSLFCVLGSLRIRGDVTENRIKSICEIKTGIEVRDHNCFGYFLRCGEHCGKAALS